MQDPSTNGIAYSPISDSTKIAALQGQGSATNVAQPTTEPQDSGNWLTHLLPTAGGILGSIGGGLLTAGLGGEFVGGGVGSAAGKGLENLLEGKSADKDVLTTGIEGGIGAGVGGAVGKGLGLVGKGLAGRATNLTTQAGEKAASNEAVAEATAIKNNYGGVRPHVQSANNLDGHLNTLKSWGVDHTNPEAMQAASKGGLFLNDIDEAALAAGSPIKTSHLISSKDITMASPEEQNALVNAGIITPEGSIPTTVTPTQANKFAQDLNGQMRDIQGVAENASKNGDFGNYQAANAQLKNLTDKYKNVQSLASTPEVDATIAARTITPEEKATLVEQYGQKQADHLEEAVNSAKTHSDLVKAKLPFAQMNTISKQALGDLKASGTARAVARVKGDVTGDGIADASVDPVTLLSAVRGANGKVGKALAVGKHVANNPNIMSTMGRISGLGEKLAPAAGAALATSPNLAADPVASTGLGAAGINDTMGGTMQPSANPQQQMIDAMRAQSILAPVMAGQSGATQFMGQVQPQLQKNALAQASLQGLPDAYANAGGAQGTGGILSQLTGLIPGTAANTYEREKATAAGNLASSLGISHEQAAALLPQLMQNQQGAGISQGILGNLSGQLIH